LADAPLRELVKKIGIDVDAYDACRSGAGAAARVEADKVEAEALGITGTPAFFVGRIESGGKVRVVEALMGARPLKQYRVALDRLLR
jgi:predicted DsbA family dithiol-disulfide isomerase